MTKIPIANAPCSWGVLEFEGLEGERITYEQMLDELRDTGYIGTELGDWGFMPTQAEALRAELAKRKLAMLGAFVPVALKNPAAHANGVAEAVKTARLLSAVASEFPSHSPIVILADDNGADPVRTHNAGRVISEMGLSTEEWKRFAEGAEHIARSVHDETGLAVAFHHHCAGYVETPEEIACFLAMTDPDLLGLVFDTGHYLYGSGGLDSQCIQDGLDRFGSRILHMHFKDCSLQIAKKARAEGWDYFTAVQHGIFSELGKGDVPFPTIVEWLNKQNYRGWIVVEQDVLPGMGSPGENAQRNRDYLRSIGL